MNGFGVFGTLDLNRYFFGELGFDFYHALPADAAAGMDRVSTHALAAVGLRMFPEFVVTPYVELGGGTEFTGIDNGPNHVDRVYPLAFIGIGAEINVTRELKLGANARFLGTMQVAESQSGTAAQNGLALKREALTAGQEDNAVPTKWGLAAQGQFFVRYAL